MKIKRKRVIVLAFEGKNNKTESLYFFHFKPKNDNFILKQFSTGMTDPIGMVKSTKIKRNQYDYNPKEDVTYIFMDGDNPKKLEEIKRLKDKVPKDIKIIITYPCFELWFLNHYIRTGKLFNNQEVIEQLKKMVPNYQKNYDIYPSIKDKQKTAIENSKYQLSLKEETSFTDVIELFVNDILEKK